MKKAASFFFPLGQQVIPSAAENSNDKMSVAQKEWPVRGRFLMARISKTNERPLEKKPLAGGVALVTGGNRGIGLAVAQQVAILGASISICGRGPTPPHDSPRRLPTLRAALANQNGHVPKPPPNVPLSFQHRPALRPPTL